MRHFLTTILLSLAVSVVAQINPQLLSGSWPAQWISVPNISQKAYGVYHFRKTFELGTKPSRFVVHVSADNRYRLFVNGREVSSGPARGDLKNWYFETVDIAPYLQNGKNVLAAMVWNMAEYMAVAQVSNQTGFILQGDTDSEKVVNTDKTWKCIKNEAFTPCSTDNGSRLWTYMVIGPGDKMEASKFPYNWQQPNFDDATWVTALTVMRGEPAGYGTDNYWTLTPRTIPAMEEKPQIIEQIRRAEGMTLAAGKLTFPITIPANSKVKILLDQTFNTVAYPELTVSGGKSASVQLTYAEALFKDRKKANRNEIEGREIMGNYDVFLPDGGAERHFRPLWYRTYRYVQLDVETKGEALTINNLYGTYTGYPFKEVASFTSNDPTLQEVWKVGFRTARLCAGETYFDCPYYEQLQYVGDTRIQALISLYMTGDDRLMRKAIDDFYQSAAPEGLTQSRYPSNRYQIIPPFSLFWVCMVHDYWMHRKDDAFVRKYLDGMRNVLEWYERHVDKSKNMLGPMKWWNFADWNRKWTNGTPPGTTDGNSSVITLQYIYTIQQAAKVFVYFNRLQDADRFMRLSGELATGTYANCFDSYKNEMADTPNKDTYSQHASIMGVLAGVVPADLQKKVLNQVLTDTDLSQATFYYRFYLMQALKKAGMADLYYSQLEPWKDMLKIGLTTFAEQPEPTRSDCHAWSASPNYDLLATVCGIMPDRPGFESVKVAPALGELTEVSAKMPHPKGEISLSLKRKGVTGITGEISLPAGTKGKFIWQGKDTELVSGVNKIER
ncbi:MAG: alpha-L-rhamnosidase N-terminal domain-containing protein [Spirosomataceae bacterium]